MELIKQQSAERVLSEMPEVHQFLDGFYLSRIGIRILIGEPHVHGAFLEGGQGGSFSIALQRL
eukprot:1140949-Pelagomonas_calceolata.AAC.5